MRHAFLIACALVAAAYTPAVSDPPPTPLNVLPPCSVPSVDTTGWQAIHHGSPLGGGLTYKLPPSFRRDKRITSGAMAWVDGVRSFMFIPGTVGSYACAMDRTPGCSECVDTLAAIPWRLVTAYERWDSLYCVVAVYPPDDSPSGSFSELKGTSPDSLDQRLFLAIFRTLRPGTLSR